MEFTEFLDLEICCRCTEASYGFFTGVRRRVTECLKVLQVGSLQDGMYASQGFLHVKATELLSFCFFYKTIYIFLRAVRFLVI